MIDGSEFDICLFLGEADGRLSEYVEADTFRLNCTPAINLFPKRAERIHLNEQFFEHRVVADRTKPQDFEVFRVDRVMGYGAKPEDETEFLPFYRANDFNALMGREGASFFAVNRRSRLLSEKEKRRGARSKYRGSESFVTLVDARQIPYPPDPELKQLGVECQCTNRDLPITMAVGKGQTDFTLADSGAPVDAIRCVAGPSKPRGTPAEGDISWRVISHVALNYLSLVDIDEERGAESLRDILRLYADPRRQEHKKQIEGVMSISSRPIVRRVERKGPISFARGLEISVLLDPDYFGDGFFVFGAVLERFFGRYVSLNSFTETVIRTVDTDAEAMRWPARLPQDDETAMRARPDGARQLL